MYILSYHKYKEKDIDPMSYIRLIPYVIILIFMGYIGYKEYNNYKNQSELKDQIISLKTELMDYKENQNQLTIQMVSDMNEINNKNYEDLNVKISKVNAVVATNNDLVAKLQTDTKRSEDDWNTYSDAKKTAYIKQINDEFRKLTEISVRIAEESDKNYDAAVTYYDILVDYHNISKPKENK